MHMSSMDTSSITAQHSNSTVEESRFRAILGFSKLLIIQTPGGGGGGGGLPYFKWRGWSKVLKFSFAGFFWLEKFGK